MTVALRRICQFVALLLASSQAFALIGVNYGGTYLSSNPLTTNEAVQIMRAQKIQAVKTFSTYPEIMQALSGYRL